MQNTNPYNRIFTKKAGIETKVLMDGRWLLHDTLDNTVTILTAPAGVLWELCDGQNNWLSLMSELRELYPHTPYETLQEESARTLLILAEQGLIEDAQ